MPRRMFHRFAVSLAALFVLGCSAALAQNTIHVPADQATIQAGINAAANGDTVLVAPGIYLENIDFKGKAITVTSSDGPAKTIIDGQKLNPTVLFIHGETAASVLSNMTVTGGQGLYYTYLGGIFIGGSSPSILNNIITANECYGIDSAGGHPLIQNNVISNTHAEPYECSFASGAGIWLYGGVQPNQSAVVLGNIIELNTYSGVEDGGGNGGGGIAIWGGNPIIENNIIRNNATGKYFSPAGGGQGGGIFYESGGGLLIQNLIYGNTSNLDGGGIAFNVGGSGAPILAVINNTIVDNSIVPVSTYSQGSLGGQQIYAGSFSEGTVFANNIVSGSTTDASVVCFDYTSPPSGGFAPLTPPILEHNDFYNSAGPIVGHDINGGCADPTGTYGNISADPQFVQPSTGDYHLRSSSPAIDAGANSAIQLAGTFGAAPTVDIEGNPRIQNTHGTPFPIIDMGAYEFAGNNAPGVTTILLTPSTYEAAAGTPITLTAQLLSPLGIPTGSVTFTVDGATLGAAPIDGAGSVQIPAGALAPGLHSFVATYAGQGGFSPATSLHIYVVVDKFGLTITLTAVPNPASVGQSVQFTVTATYLDKFMATPIVLTDTSTNTVLASITPNSSGVATFTTSTLAIGFHYLSAAYAGDQQHAAGTAYGDVQIIDPYVTTTSLRAAPAPSVSGQNVIFTATVAASTITPAGSVQFTDGATILGTQPLGPNGIAAFGTNSLTVGNHTITATYIPTGGFLSSFANLIQQVQSGYPTSTIITSSLNPSTLGQGVTFSAHVASANGTPTGTVTFTEGATILGIQNLFGSGDANQVKSGLTPGTHIITATYNPTGTFAASSASLTQTVNGLPTTTLLTATPLTGVAHITPITLTATVAAVTPGGPTLTGQVIFYINGAQFNLATLVNGVATFTGTLPAGTDQIYAAYTADPAHIYNSSTSNTLTVTITPAPSTLSLTSSLNPSPALTPFTLSAQLGIPGGIQPGAGYSIAFTIAPATSAQAATNASGTAAYTSAGLLPGQYLVTATFAGATDLQPSTATFIETVTANPTATTLTAFPNPGIQNNPVTFTSAVSALTGAASPAGTVTIYDSLSPNPAFTPIATLTVPSPATFTTNALAPGTHILYAAFTPAAGFVASQSAQFTLVIEPQSFTLTLSEPNLSLQTGHHHTETASLTSIGGLAGTFTLSCATLPQYASCAWAQGSVTLPANGTVSTSLTIDTDQLLDFVASNTRPAADSSGGPSIPRSLRHNWGTTAAFTLFPLTLLGLRRRRNLRSLLPLLILATLATTLTACGASQYPYSTAPGTYTVLVTAAGPPAPGGVSPTQTVNLTLVVTR